MTRVRCPICEKHFDREASTALPFCGERCRQIDLARWLGEQYRMPIERHDDEDAEEGPS